MIKPLPRKHAVVVKARWPAAKMPFPNYRSVITGLLQVFGHMRLRAVEGVENRHAILMTVFASENRRPARSANRILHKAVLEPHAFSRQPVHIWRAVNLPAIGADGVRSMIVSHDEQNVRARSPAQRRRCKKQ